MLEKGQCRAYTGRNPACICPFSILIGARMTLSIRKFQGGKEYKKFLQGKSLTRKESMLVHCYECMGGYDEGKQDCQGKSCPLYSYYPYKNELAGL
jgi:hypothetical protein